MATLRFSSARHALVSCRCISHWRVKQRLWLGTPRNIPSSGGSGGSDFGVLQRPRVLSEKRRASQWFELVPLHFHEAFEETEALLLSSSRAAEAGRVAAGFTNTEDQSYVRDVVCVALQQVCKFHAELRRLRDRRRRGIGGDSSDNRIAEEAFKWIVDFDASLLQRDSSLALSSGEAGLLLAARAELIRPSLNKWRRLILDGKDGGFPKTFLDEVLAAKCEKLQTFTKASALLLKAASSRLRSVCAVHAARYGLEHLGLLATVWVLSKRSLLLAESPFGASCGLLSKTKGEELSSGIEALPFEQHRSGFLRALTGAVSSSSSSFSSPSSPSMQVLARAAAAATARDLKAFLQFRAERLCSGSDCAASREEGRRECAEFVKAVVASRAALGAQSLDLSPSEAFSFVTAIARESIFNSPLWDSAVIAVQRSPEELSVEMLVGLTRAFALRSAELSNSAQRNNRVSTAVSEETVAREQAALMITVASKEFCETRLHATQTKPGKSTSSSALPWEVCCGLLEAMSKARIAEKSLLRRVEMSLLSQIETRHSVAELALCVSCLAKLGLSEKTVLEALLIRASEKVQTADWHSLALLLQTACKVRQTSPECLSSTRTGPGPSASLPFSEDRLQLCAYLSLQSIAETPFDEFARLFARATLTRLRGNGPQSREIQSAESIPPRSVSLLSYCVAKTLKCLTAEPAFSEEAELEDSQLPSSDRGLLSIREMLSLLGELAEAAVASVSRFELSELSNATFATAAFTRYAASLEDRQLSQCEAELKQRVFNHASAFFDRLQTRLLSDWSQKQRPLCSAQEVLKIVCAFETFNKALRIGGVSNLTRGECGSRPTATASPAQRRALVRALRIHQKQLVALSRKQRHQLASAVAALRLGDCDILEVLLDQTATRRMLSLV